MLLSQSSVGRWVYAVPGQQLATFNVNLRTGRCFKGSFVVVVPDCLVFSIVTAPPSSVTAHAVLGAVAWFVGVTLKQQKKTWIRIVFLISFCFARLLLRCCCCAWRPTRRLRRWRRLESGESRRTPNKFASHFSLLFSFFLSARRSERRRSGWAWPWRSRACLRPDRRPRARAARTAFSD